MIPLTGMAANLLERILLTVIALVLRPLDQALTAWKNRVERTDHHE